MSYCAKQDDAHLIIRSGVDSIYYFGSNALESDYYGYISIMIRFKHTRSAVDSIDGEFFKAVLLLLIVQLARRASSFNYDKHCIPLTVLS